MRRYKGKCDIFIGIEHRLRTEEMEEQLNKEAADAARITDGRAGREDEKHTSGRVFVAVDSNLGAQLLERKEEQLCPSQATRVELPRLG